MLHAIGIPKLGDLKCSPDLRNNVKKVKVNLGLLLKHILFYHIWGWWPFWSSNLKQSYMGVVAILVK